MVKVWRSVVLFLGVWATTQALFSTPAAAQLDPFFYIETCPKLFPIVGKYVYSAIQNETRIAASLLRVHFHDCFVQGCDASLLLDGVGTEKTTPPNNNSVRGFEVIDSIKAAVESSCPNTVSCADIVTLASFFSVALSGGPIWWVPLGRRDCLTTNASLTSNLPGPSLDISKLKDKFINGQNLTTTDLVALSGGHTIGIARCAAIVARLYTYNGTTGATDPYINATLLQALETRCPNTNDAAALNVTNFLDIQTGTVFDNLYFKNLLEGNGILQSDQELFSTANDTMALVQLYADNQDKFFQDFATSMIKMGNLLPLTGTQGEIRKNCRVPNSASSSVTVEGEVASEEKPLEKIVHEVKQVNGGAELFDGAVEFFKDVMQKVVKELEEEELHKKIADIVDGGHSSM